MTPDENNVLMKADHVKVYFKGKNKKWGKIMTKYTVKLSEEDYQMLKDCHSKNPSIMKALDEAKKED